MIHVNVEVSDLEPMPKSTIRVLKMSSVDQSVLRSKLEGKARGEDWLRRMRASLSRIQNQSINPYRNWPSSYAEWSASFDPYSSVSFTES